MCNPSESAKPHREADGGLSALILGFGDAFHLVPRLLNYFISADMTVALIPVAVGAGAIPMLGMLMLPKTVCYILMILVFLFATLKDPVI